MRMLLVKDKENKSFKMAKFVACLKSYRKSMKVVSIWSSSEKSLELEEF